MENKAIRNKIEGAIRGLIFGDALGVPYEFKKREYFDNNKVTKLVEGGTHGQPKGYWSDDSGLMLACMQSLMTGKPYAENAAKEMVHGWWKDGKYMNENYIFDIGCTTQFAFRNIVNGISHKDSGPTNINSNGNGALMKVLPYSLCRWYSEGIKVTAGEIIEMCGITHNHAISHIGCSLYTIMINDLVQSSSVCYDFRDIDMISDRIKTEESDFKDYDQLYNIKKQTREDIQSSGYVAHTLVAATWCLETTNSYMECVCKAVELGGDTDTIAAIAGSLAGAKYGFESFKEEYKEIPKIDYIEKLIENFVNKVAED